MTTTTTYIFGLLFIIILTWLVYRLTYLALKKRQYKKAFWETFNDNMISFPELETSFSYSYPSFTVIFKSLDDLEFAKENRLTSMFNLKIQQIHKDIADFDATNAVFYTHIGKTPRL